MCRGRALFSGPCGGRFCRRRGGHRAPQGTALSCSERDIVGSTGDPITLLSRRGEQTSPCRGGERPCESAKSTQTEPDSEPGPSRPPPGTVLPAGALISSGVSRFSSSREDFYRLRVEQCGPGMHPELPRSRRRGCLTSASVRET